MFGQTIPLKKESLTKEQRKATKKLMKAFVKDDLLLGWGQGGMYVSRDYNLTIELEIKPKPQPVVRITFDNLKEFEDWCKDL